MNTSLMQVVSLAGALLVLVGYGGQQYAGLRSEGASYGVLNLAGSLLLAWSAIAPLNLGVLVLESAWAAISLGIVVKALRRRGDGAGSEGGPLSP